MLFRILAPCLTIVLAMLPTVVLSIDPGVYQITNAYSHSTVRSYRKGDTIMVSSTREWPGPFQQWEVKQSEDGYTLKSLGLDAFITVNNEDEGVPVTTSDDGTTFVIKTSDEEEDTYTIETLSGTLSGSLNRLPFPAGLSHSEPRKAIRASFGSSEVIRILERATNILWSLSY